MTTRLTELDIAWIKRILDECIHAQRLHQSLLHSEMLVKRPRIDRDIVDGMESTLAKLESLRAMFDEPAPPQFPHLKPTETKLAKLK